MILLTLKASEKKEKEKQMKKILALCLLTFFIIMTPGSENTMLDDATDTVGILYKGKRRTGRGGG